MRSLIITLLIEKVLFYFILKKLGRIHRCRTDLVADAIDILLKLSMAIAAAGNKKLVLLTKFGTAAAVFV